MPVLSTPLRGVLRLLPAIFMPVILLALFISLGQAEAQSEMPTAVSPPATVETIQQTESGLSFVLRTAVFHTTANGDITLDGLDATLNTPGAPRLPYYTTWIALPPQAQPTINVDLGHTTTQAIAQPALAPEPALAYSNEAENPLFPDTPRGSLPAELTPDFFSQAEWFPTAVYHLSDPIYYRDLRLVQLTIFPLRYLAAQSQLWHAPEIHVNLTFSGGTPAPAHPLPGSRESDYQAMRPHILNFEQALTWRHQPPTLQNLPGPGLPIGVATYKIHVDTDALYAISGAELAAAGMNLNEIDPHTLKMMHRGQPVAYQFVGNPDDGFQSGEAIRFFGAAFSGSRLETQFVNDNIYWLWADDTPAIVSQRANDAGQGQPLVTSFRSTISREPERIHHSSWTNRWHEFPNEPDAWYWELVRQNQDILTRTYAITLPHPAATGADPYYEVELLSREANTAPTNFLYDVRATINNHPEQGQVTWQRLRNVNITATQPITTLLPGVNQVSVIFATDRSVQPGDPRVFLNRISVEYERQLTAVADQLIFAKTDTPGQQQFQVANFSQNDPAQILVWDISDPLQPQQVEMTAAHISGNGPYTYTFTSDTAADGRYLATTAANVQSVKQVSQYIPASLEPAHGADWLALSHSDFHNQAQQLADHRADPQFGGLETAVIDIEDLINQFGYGLPLPESIRHYLGYALANWPTAPRYVTLVGGGTLNPRNLDCLDPACRSDWDPDQPNFVLTDIQFVDRFQGAIPSDHTFVTLAGDDLIPDMAIGRLVVNTPAEADIIVSKIIQYDQNQLTPADSQRHFLYVADTADSAGNFCLENENGGAKLPTSLVQSHLCMEAAIETEADRVRSGMAAEVNGEGVNIINYRGHGSVQFWVRGLYPLFTVNPAASGAYGQQVYITSTTPITGFWRNVDQPVIIISADCLDGNFGFPGGFQALSRVFMALPDVATAAHWSSTGLGFTFEHTILVDALYNGAFDLGQPAIGDAINNAKLVYYSAGQHESELYSFTLQGDPAMQMYRPDLRLEKSSPQSSAPMYAGDIVTFTLDLSNQGIFASQITLTDSLPAGLQYLNHSASLPVSLTLDGGDLQFDLGAPLAWGESAQITITAVITPGAVGLLTNTAVVHSGGWDLQPTDNSASANIMVLPPPGYWLYLPNMTKP